MALEELVTELKTVWKFDYEPSIKALRDLYETAKKEQWNAATDIHWDQEIDKDGDILDPEQDPFRSFDFVKALPEDKQKELAVRRAAWTLSQFLHGEQGALLCCGQLVEAVPDMDGKLYASTQVIDEARHVEVFHRYVQRLDRVYPIDPALQTVLNAILEADMWQMKCVGMQVIVESLAMGSFKIMKKGTRDPLLKSIVELTAQDEARHVSYGLIYMKDEIPKLSEPDRDRLEDFAWTAVDIMAGQGRRMSSQAELYAGLGIDTKAAMEELRERFRDPKRRANRPNAFRQYVIPQLQRIDLITERTAPNYRKLGFEL